jgi:predicted O-linked N-acetylglucosamine transferase (SPINDLY family)
MATELDARVNHAAALHGRGVVALQKNHVALAAELLSEAVSLDPSSLPALVNYGTALHELGRFEEALSSCERAIALAPDCAEAYYNRGNALRELNRFSAAVASYDRAIALKPDYADAYLNRGLALSALARPSDALASYDAAIAVRPQNPDAYFNRGNELHRLGRFEAAIASYDRASALQPGFADAHLNRGTAFVELRRYPEAVASYDTAIACRPDGAQAHFNRAAALLYMGQYGAAIASYDRAIALQPGYAAAHVGRGSAMLRLRRYVEAIASYDRALALDPSATGFLGMRRHIKMRICDWSGLDEDVAKITAGIDEPGAVSNPFSLLNLCDSADLQRRAAASWVAAQGPATSAIADIPRRNRTGRIHVGYFSADYHEHATACLIAQLLELHDRSSFKITGLSFGPPSAGAMRRRLAAACDEFIDVRGESDAAVARLARSRGIDIAVDLKGFTQDNRMGIFAHRAAPLQVNFLGYPGTMAAPFMDYLIADRTLVPANSEPHYTEKIIFLPHSYQVNDATRPIAAKSYTRAELNLPANGFVFCCFNNAYKIMPATFERWMRILARVEGSVLWLLGDNPTMMNNLRREAAARGVAPERLIFADRIDLPHHLARHRAADLFIDTLPYNAHTTASDALWAGLPVLTCPGETFAARVGASLLTAIGLTDLIASAPEHYEQTAIHLSTHPQALGEVRKRLMQRRITAPLFDTPRYCRHLESAFAQIHERHLAGSAPEHLHVESNGLE